MTISGSLAAPDKPHFVDSIREALASNPKRLLAALEKLNDAILMHGLDGERSPVSFFALARLLDHVALLEGQDRASRAATRKQRKKSGAEEQEPDPNVRRWWSLLTTQYGAFRDELGSSASKHFPPIRNPDGIAAFCRLQTRRTGNHAPFFYSSLAALVVYMAEKSLLDSPELNLVTPVDERSLSAEIRAVFDEILDETASPETRPSHESSGPRPLRATMGFDYHDADLAVIEDYCLRFATDEQRCARFIVYRPMLSDPTRLIKSYLAITAPPVEVDRNVPRVARFNHFYWPPPGRLSGADGQLTSGRVIPLAEGFYLIGGRRDLDRRRRPFRTMMVIALPRYAVLHQESRVGALGLSANRRGNHLISRAAIRATPLPAYQHEGTAGALVLGDVAIDALAEDLQKDAALEREFAEAAGDPGKEWSSRFPLCGDRRQEEIIAEQTRGIIDLCNNQPNPDSGWTISPGCTADGMALSKVSVEQRLESAFASAQPGTFAKPGARFDFWSASLFGPLAGR